MQPSSHTQVQPVANGKIISKRTRHRRIETPFPTRYSTQSV
jgi:hypothetical protein